jgi:hypothetical protein
MYLKIFLVITFEGFFGGEKMFQKEGKMSGRSGGEVSGRVFRAGGKVPGEVPRAGSKVPGKVPREGGGRMSAKVPRAGMSKKFFPDNLLK